MNKINYLLIFVLLICASYSNAQLFKNSAQPSNLLRLDINDKDEDKVVEEKEEKQNEEAEKKESIESNEVKKEVKEPVKPAAVNNNTNTNVAKKPVEPVTKYPQQKNNYQNLEKISSAEDRLIFEIAHSNWYSDPKLANLKKRWFSRAFNAYFMYDFDLNGKRNFGFAPGIGLGTNIIALDNTLFIDTAGVTQFRIIPDSINYSRNNLVTSYIDIPIEFRIRTNPDKNGKRWKIALGFKAGYLFNSHTKYVGDDLVIPDEDNTKVKTYRLKNISNVRYGYLARFGYGNFNIIGYYNANTLFQKDKGPGIHPWYIGFSFNSL